MRRSYKKRTLALLMALTVFLSSCFFIAFKMDVFGARNKNNPNTDYQYSKQNESRSLKVGIRGNSCPTDADIVLTDEGSNVNGKTPKQSYDGWDPNKFFTPSPSASPLPVVPGTHGAKGTEGNPFVILEVVPDKTMQELSYYSGSPEAGLPFDDGQLSATMMMELRARNNNDKSLKNIRFTDLEYRYNSDGSANDPATFINNNFTTKLDGIFGPWCVRINYNIFGDSHKAIEVRDEAGQIVKDENGKVKYKYEDSVPLFDATNKSNRTSGYNFNKIYDFEITTDDLLTTYPSSWKGQEKYKYNERRDEDGYAGSSELYYTDDLVCLAKTEDNSDPSKIDVEKFIRDTLMSRDNALNYNTVKSRRTTSPNGVGQQQVQNTDIIKYNLKTYIAKTSIFKKNYVDGDNYGQDVTTNDLKKSGEFSDADIRYSIFQRSTDKDTKNLSMQADLGYEVSNYWKVRFRKYYVDHFEELYQAFKEKQGVWSTAEQKSNWTDRVTGSDGRSITKQDALDERNAALHKLFREYEPLFKRKGVIGEKAFEDGYDWDTNDNGRMLSEIRKYTSNAKEIVTDYSGGWKEEAGRNGGYILAVKTPEEVQGTQYDALPVADQGEKVTDNNGTEHYYTNTGGDMYLMTDREIYKKLNGLSEEQMSGLSASDVKTDEVVFTRDPGDLSGSVTNKASRRRWVYVPSLWGLHGSQAASNSDGYICGYLDDSKYTMGYASKSFYDKNHYWLAIYDRNNRKYHADDSSFDELSDKMLNKTDVVIDETFRGKDVEVTTKDNPQKTDWMKYKDVLSMGRDSNDWSVFDAFNRKGAEDRVRYNTYGIENKHYRLTLNGKEVVDSRTDQVYNSYARGVKGSTLDQVYPIDEFHLNVINEIKSYLGLTDSSREITDIKAHDNLINGANSDPAWTGFVRGYGHEEKNFLFEQNNAKWLAGFCFNFNSGTPYNSGGWLERPDTYDSKIAGDGTIITPARARVEERRFKSAAGNNKEQKENKKGDSSDDVRLVSDKQTVTEMVKKYSFSYYGFKANDILKNTLFSFKDEDSYNNFHYKVIVATPAELNKIYDLAKSENNKAGKSYANEKDEKIKLDLIERADMFYIHTHSTKTVSEQDNWNQAYKLYSNAVLGTTGDLSIPQISNLPSFYENDLEWDLVMKLIKRSSQTHGITIPILFNSLVTRMTEEGVDSGNNTYGPGNDPKDTSMYLFGEQNGSEKEWNGNMCNISKLALILLQFDLHARTDSTSIRDTRTSISEEYYPDPGNIYWKQTREVPNPNYGQIMKSDSGETLKVKRSFMQDIFPYIRSVEKDPGYKATTKNAVEGSARFTGFVVSEASEGFVRKLNGNTNWHKNSLDLWNRFTFLPSDIYMGDYDYVKYLQQGYLPTYWGEDGVKAGGNIFSRDGSNQNDYARRNGTTGGDYQNVYVLHRSEIGAHGVSLVSWYSDGEDKYMCDTFLNMTFTILSNPGEPEDFEIISKPRQDHKYSILTLNKQLSATDTQDELLIPYFTDVKRYPSTRIETLKELDNDILVLAHNSNNLGDYAYIEEVYLQDSSKNIVDSETGEVSNESEIQIPLTDLYGSKKIIYGGVGKEKDGTINANYSVTSDNYSEIKRGDDRIQNVSYNGIRLDGGEKTYIWLPYKLRDFFCSNDASEKRDKYSYNRVLIKGHYLYNNIREDVFVETPFTKYIDIDPKELAMLE